MCHLEWIRGVFVISIEDLDRPSSPDRMDQQRHIRDTQVFNARSSIAEFQPASLDSSILYLNSHLVRTRYLGLAFMLWYSGAEILALQAEIAFCYLREG
jgi:hypothetical protein